MERGIAYTPVRLRGTASGANPVRGKWRASRTREAAKTGGARRDRTADLLIANEALSQLSYGP